MRRLAMFVEGFTELKFIEKLVREIADRKDIAIKQQRIIGGTTRAKQYITLHADTPSKGCTHYLLLIDSKGDAAVAQRIREEHESLTAAGYERLIGLRDVRPDFDRKDIAQLRTGLKYGIKTKLAPVEFFLAIMEIEAWFLAEDTHFSRVHADITPERIESILGFNPRTDDMSLRDNPAQDLIDCYALEGVQYDKGGEFTVPLLDMVHMYAETAPRVQDLQGLIASLEDFLSSDATP